MKERKMLTTLLKWERGVKSTNELGMGNLIRIFGLLPQYLVEQRDLLPGITHPHLMFLNHYLHNSGYIAD